MDPVGGWIRGAGGLGEQGIGHGRARTGNGIKGMNLGSIR